MKHQHSADVTIKVDVPTQDIEQLIDKVTDASLVIIGALTAAHILKSLFRTGE